MAIEKYSKIIDDQGEKAVGLMYFDELYKVQILVELNTKTIHVCDMVNYPNTNFSSFDEIINKVKEELQGNWKADAINITKEEFNKIIKRHNLGSDYILKIKEKLPMEVINNILSK